MLLPPLSNTTQAVSTRTDMPSRTPYSDSRLLLFWCVVHWVEGGDRMWLHPLKDPEDLEDLCALAASQHGLQGASSAANQDLPTALIPKVNTEERVWSLLGTLNTQLSIRTIHFTTGLVTNTSETHLTTSPLKVHEYRLSTLQSVSPILAALEVKRLISKHAPDVPLSPSEATVTPLVDVLYRSMPTSATTPLSKPTTQQRPSTTPTPTTTTTALAHTTALALLNRAEYGPLCWSGIESLVGMSRVELEASVLSGNMSTSQLLSSPTPHLTSHKVFMGALESSNDHKRATLQLLQLLTAGTTLFQHPNMPATLPTVLNNTRLLEGLPGSGRTTILANFAAASIFGDAARLQAGRRAGQAPLLAELGESRSYLSYLFLEGSAISANSSSRLRHAKAVETALGHFRSTCNAQHALLRLHQLDNNPYPNNENEEQMEKYQKLALRSVPVICIETAAGTLKNSVLALSGTTKDVDTTTSPFSGTIPQLMSVGLAKALRSPLLHSPYPSVTANTSDDGVLRLQEIIEYIDSNGGVNVGSAVLPSDSVSALLMSLLPPTAVAELNIQHTVNGMNINESLAELFPGACALFTRCTALRGLLDGNTMTTNMASASSSEINQYLFASLGRSVGQTEVIAKLLYREALTNAAQHAMRPDGSEAPQQDDAPPPPTYTPDPEEGLQCRVDLSWVVPQPTFAINPLPSSEVFWGPVRNAHDIRQQLITFEQASRKSETATSSAAPPPPTTTPTSVFGTDISPVNFIGATIAPVLHSTLGNVITFHDIPADESSPGHLLDTALNTVLARDAEDTSAPIPRRSRSIFTLSAAELAAIDEELLQLYRYVVGKEYISKVSSLTSTPSSTPVTTTSSSCISNAMVGLARHHFYGRSAGQQQDGSNNSSRLTIQPIALDSGTISTTPLQPVAASLFVQGHLAPAYSRYLSAITTGISSTLPFIDRSNTQQQQLGSSTGSDSTGLSTSIFSRTSDVPCVVIADDSDTYHVNTFLSLPSPTVFATSSHPAQGLRSIPQADTNLRHKLSDMLSASHKATTGGSLMSTYDTCPSAGTATPWQKSFSEEEVVILKEAERIVKSCEISTQRVDSIVLSECHHAASATAVEESRRVAKINKWKGRMAMLQFANRSALLPVSYTHLTLPTKRIV
eukprot:TRINITY_DN10674_c0_g3_i1.p1 TRINITY_DN10674_c0_g3~~TRINITY_DN10674_c0_g3_i1.p1  ORF type:complete len:1147 (+),score=145.88 TRINITY_DN10674_c0_g3_i1:458-3898(+)